MWKSRAVAILHGMERGDKGLEQHEVRRTEVFDGEVRHTETGERFNVLKAPYKIDQEHSLAGIYEHYKSTPENPKLYGVICVAKNTETGEQLVIYLPLYETDEPLASARPLQMFSEEVEVEGRLVPRFRFVTDNIETL